MPKNPRACRFCGTVAHGPGCIYSGTGYHKEVGDSEHCIYCGSTAYNVGCIYSETSNLHKHGHGESKCVWCGAKTKGGPGCPISPNHRHEI